MRETRIDSFEELHRALEPQRRGGLWLYRGQAEADWQLVPQIGRCEEFGRSERDLFAAWKRGAVQFLEPGPPSDWDWLAIAQHHGLATRLLDWTINPLVAAFFASCHQRQGEAVVWAFAPNKGAATEEGGPFEVEGVLLYRPGAHATRIARQGTAFTIHGPPTREVTDADGELHRLVIAPDYRPLLLAELSRYGYNHATMFPDLDGLSRFMNWLAATGRLPEERVG
jgi:hypothetical protein